MLENVIVSFDLTMNFRCTVDKARSRFRQLGQVVKGRLDQRTVYLAL
jgi:hypothetical protein